MLADTVQRFKTHLKKMDAYDHAMGVLNYDAETVMPKKAAEHMGATMGALSEESYKLLVNDELKGMLEEILAHSEEVDYVTRREAEELSESLRKMSAVPMDEYVTFNIERNMASAVWHEAKVNNDYAAFEPHLKKIIEFMRKYAAYINPDMPAYDALLNEYEKGLTAATLDEYFAAVRAKLVPVIRAIGEKGVQPDVSFLLKSFPIAKQRELSDFVMKLMTIDRDCCAIGEVEHPFTTNFCKYDVRITTHYHENAPGSSLFSVIHEGGHALYELHTGDELMFSPLGGGVSMGIHESQSRFYENIIGRSREFLSLLMPKLCELFPEQMEGVTLDMLYRAANMATPSLIRTEADELTYSLHIMIRYELEKQLIAGTLSTEELPAAWNRLYKEYLGVDVPSDTEGVLQDTHWSGGMVGYFPSYSIGSAYSAQIYAAMLNEMDVPALVAKGELEPVVAWLTEKIYKYGRLKTPAELIEGACGAPFDPKFYTDYLVGKYSALYELD